MRHQPIGILLSSFFVSAIVLLCKPSVQAQITVNNVNDSGSGSLRNAILTASSGQTITFGSNLAGQTIQLTSGELLLNQNLTIDASALPGGIQISGHGASRIFEVSGSVVVVLNSLSVANGFDNNGNGGGGIYNAGTLTINDGILSNNSIGPTDEANYNGGGGICNNGTLTINECTLSGNSSGSVGGGGIYNGGTLTLNESTLSGNSANRGGGIYNGGMLTVNECTFSGNSAAEAGGGIGGYGTMAINESTLSSNSAVFGGGINPQSSGSTTVTNSIIAGNTASAGDGSDIYLNSALLYGGSNLVQVVVNSGGTITGSAPINASPKLNSLGNYGGPTQTMPPLSGSPALDAGSASANIFTTDQRGLPRLSGSQMDLGSVEVQVLLQMAIVHSGTNLILTWPTNSTGLTLQSTTNLVPSAVWITNLPSPVVINGQNTVTNSISGARMFFRLAN